MKNLSFLQQGYFHLLILLTGVLLASSCGVVVPNLQSQAYCGRTTSGLLDVEEPYSVGAFQCRTKLFPNALFPIESAQPDQAYMNTLTATFPNWTFQNAANNLGDDAIEIRTYDAVGNASRVGVEIHAVYNPQAGDPTNNIHWIQILTTNHGLRGTNHGPIATYVDVRQGVATTPYYDDGYCGDNRNIYDLPSRTDVTANHTWQATTFLVQGPAIGSGPGTVTFLTPGFTWGFENTCSATDGVEKTFLYTLDEPVKYELAEELRPGGKLVLKTDRSLNLRLTREKSQGRVPLEGQRISFNIGKTDAASGLSALDLEGGEMRFGNYKFGEKEYPAAAAKVKQAEGFIQWETGETSLNYTVSLALPDGKTQDITFHATGLYDSEAKVFTIRDDFNGISEEFLKAHVPEDNGRSKDKGGK